jgi:hypothetical protein
MGKRNNHIFSFAIVLYAMVTVTGCTFHEEWCSRKPGLVEDTGDIPFHLHIHAFFRGEVEVCRNNMLIFSDVVRPNPILGYAEFEKTGEPAFTYMEVREGEKFVQVWYDGDLLADTTFTVQDTTYLGIGYDSHRGGVIFRIQDRPFFYY